MPPMGTVVPGREAVALLTAWVESLGPDTPEAPSGCRLGSR